MKLTFANGTDLQKAACRTVVGNLLNLPSEAMPVEVLVEFVADPLAGMHNEFAATLWTYNSNSATTRIANVAPHWPEPWEGMRFLQETFAHELGHVLFAALTEAGRLAVAGLFGADTDDPAVLQPPGTPWEDHVMEGIAETFKDAFLPRRFRRYSNRTRRLLSISRYPEFRKLFREGLETIPVRGTVIVPEYDVDVFADPGIFSGGSKVEPYLYHLVSPAGSAGSEYWKDRGSLNDGSVNIPIGRYGAEIQTRYDAWIKEDAVLEYAFVIPPSIDPYGVRPYRASELYAYLPPNFATEGGENVHGTFGSVPPDISLIRGPGSIDGEFSAPGYLGEGPSVTVEAKVGTTESFPFSGRKFDSFILRQWESGMEPLLENTWERIDSGFNNSHVLWKHIGTRSPDQTPIGSLWNFDQVHEAEIAGSTARFPEAMRFELEGSGSNVLVSQTIQITPNLLNWSKRECGGHKYFHVWFYFRLAASVMGFPESESAYKSLVLSLRPTMVFKQARCGGTDPGVPIVLPSGAVGPEATSRERHRTNRRVVGAHFE